MVLVVFTALLLSFTLSAGTLQKKTRVFAEIEGAALKLDIYKTDSATILSQPCLIFVFGGGFKEGQRNAEFYAGELLQLKCKNT